eukprot:CAMPEP_0178401764 /NCGR_PEP_ID=MMETSP0689_2-20121128/16473_1 /TAXON_ID=160604 /ORGANISM="Amphidinium massartii, Strain CS-259" /LENGTH=411 /DNA_ID=CAMNT_0020022601 /DNA_START=100 /DNA_END=1335 /DNA_ORIENTATION=-
MAHASSGGRLFPAAGAQVQPTLVSTSASGSMRSTAVAVGSIAAVAAACKVSSRHANRRISTTSRGRRTQLWARHHRKEGRWTAKDYGRDKRWQEAYEEKWKRYEAEDRQAEQFWKIERGQDPTYVDLSSPSAQEKDGRWLEEGRHALPLLRLKPADVPNIGANQMLRVNVADHGPGALAAINYASFKKGLLWCAPEVEDAVSLPRGGVGAEIVSMARVSEEEVCVSLRGVTNVRLLVRHPPKRLPAELMIARVEEVHDWSVEESRRPLEEISKELQSLEELFKECSELQRRSGLTAAGNFSITSVAEKTEAVLEALAELPLNISSDKPGYQELSEADEMEMRRIGAAVHVMAGAFSGPMRIRLLCEPKPVLARMKQVQELLEKVRGVLCARLAFHRAFEDDANDGNSSTES